MNRNEAYYTTSPREKKRSNSPAKVIDLCDNEEKLSATG